MSTNIEKIITVIDYIENNLNEKLDLTTIAKSVGYSKFHLHRMFINTVGLSIHDYVQRRQITESAKLLLYSNKSILEISLLSGYESQQAFTNAFKQMYKIPPNLYRLKEEFYPLQLKIILDKNLLRTLSRTQMIKQITYASNLDIPLLIEFVHLTIDGFPNLNEFEYLKALTLSIKENRTLILKQNDLIIALMVFNYSNGMIDFFGVHPLYRNQGVTKIFLDKLINQILKDKEISITTFREGDRADTGYRKAYKELGFVEAELLTEFGYPTQKFILITNCGEIKSD